VLGSAKIGRNTQPCCGDDEPDEICNGDRHNVDRNVGRYHQLAEGAITNGRSETERVNRVIVFSGQSLKGPQGSEAFLKLGDGAINEIDGKSASAAGRAQAIAFRLGKGRVVVLGDAAMLSAQVAGSDNQPVGMNVPNVDNRQLALNIMHWLSGMLK